MDNKLKILPGLSPTDSLEDFYSKGIREVYAGFYDELSEKKWPVAFNTINRRGEGASFYGFKNFSAAVDKAAECGMSVFVAFNVNYSKQQLPWVLKSINKVSKKMAVKGVIVSDINLLLMLKKQKYKKEIIISTLGAVLNKYSIEFYKSLGASRFVLDRQLTALEILSFANSFAQTQFEIFFLMGDGCFFIDGYCSSLHIQETEKNKQYDTTIKSTLCMDVFNSLNSVNAGFSNREILPYKCNICVLYHLKFLKNVTLKIPNRSITNSTGISIADTILEIEKELDKKNIDFAKFRKFCAGFLLKKKNIKCNPKICLCRDLYAKSDNN